MNDRPRILIVDDDPLIVSALCAFFDLQGEFEATGCSCPLAALGRVGSEPVDVVIADHLMPGMNGIELLARLAEQHPSVRRVLLTGCCGHGAGALDGLARAHLHGYLEKPWDNSAIEALLRRVVDANDPARREQPPSARPAAVRESSGVHAR